MPAIQAIIETTWSAFVQGTEAPKVRSSRLQVHEGEPTKPSAIVLAGITPTTHGCRPASADQTGERRTPRFSSRKTRLARSAQDAACGFR